VAFFYIAGAVVIVIAVVFLFKNPKTKPTVQQHKKMILRKEYWLFYVLNFLGGARRQIFMVFAIFMLVQKFHYSIKEVTILFVINNTINYFLAPLFGKGINRFGERLMLSMEYLALIFVFIGYAMVQQAWVAALLYILDQAFFGAAIATNTFFQKTARPADIAPSMAVGFTINHISAVIIPVVGGALWLLNWRIPFIAGAFFALAALAFSQLVKIPEKD
jgi:MFS family permease